MLNILVVLILGFLLVDNYSAKAERLPENVRKEKWVEKYRAWPIYWQNNSESFVENMYNIREKELQRIPGANERWENYVSDEMTCSYSLLNITNSTFVHYRCNLRNLLWSQDLQKMDLK